MNPKYYITKASDLKKGSDYGYTWPDEIQIKESVCHSNGVDLIA